MGELKVTVNSWGEVALDKREMKKVMRAAGNEIKSKTARLINSTSGGGQVYHYRSKQGTYVASTPGNPPVRASGALRSSLRTYPYPSGEGFAVRAGKYYALFLEAGAKGGGNPYGRSGGGASGEHSARKRKRRKGQYTTRVLEPRPFLDRVMAQEAPEIDRRVKQAMSQALTWKQTAAK